MCCGIFTFAQAHPARRQARPAYSGGARLVRALVAFCISILTGGTGICWLALVRPLPKKAALPAL